MKRFVLGLVLLCLTLGSCLWVSQSMARTHGPISEKLHEAQSLALEGEQLKGVAAARQARQLWQKSWELTAAVVDHAPMDEIDGLFAQMESYARGDSSVEFAGICARLAELIDAVAEANSFAWWSFL